MNLFALQSLLLDTGVFICCHMFLILIEAQRDYAYMINCYIFLLIIYGDVVIEIILLLSQLSSRQSFKLVVTLSACVF